MLGEGARDETDIFNSRPARIIRESQQSWKPRCGKSTVPLAEREKSRLKNDAATLGEKERERDGKKLLSLPPSQFRSLQQRDEREESAESFARAEVTKRRDPRKR